MPGRALLRLTALLLPPTVAVAALFAALAPEPYMDEPFHVPQTQRWCAGRWRDWDPKITTFPGLYFFGVAAGRLEAALLSALGCPPAQPCSTTALRSVNLLFATACLPLFYGTAQALDASRSQAQLLLMTAACFLFPLHFFFTFLYYTDVPSLFSVLAAYLAAVPHRRYRLGAALGAAAVLMRQTNAVWAAYALAAAALDRCLPAGGGSKRQKDGSGDVTSSKNGSRSSQGDSGRRGGNKAAGSSPANGGPIALLAAIPGELARCARQAWLLRRQLAADLWPLAAVVAAFAAFVVANGGIVVGDKAHHTPVRHLAQPLYCLLYCTAWLAPALWSPAALRSTARTLRSSLRSAPGLTAAALVGFTAAASAAVHIGTLAHPFLLADNRHYTFYLWRRLVNATPWSRYALLPAYLYAGWAAAAALSHRRSTWVLGLAGAAAVVLVPAHLVEFRYFTVPFYLFFLHMRTPSPAALAATVALFAAVNAATIYLFLARPFTWPDGSTARFMW
ncbi:hypothetical protein ABPG75_003525 [Micractinium tetrahymenae]